MKSIKGNILTINGGSSSIKFALYEVQESLQQLFSAEIENIGFLNASLNFTDTVTNQKNKTGIHAPDHDTAAHFLIDWFEKRYGFISVKAVGHRIVYGMKHTGPEQITPALLAELKKISAYDPEHLPGEIALIEIFEKRIPGLMQVACFDTSFHSSMPLIAKMLAIPHRFAAMGIQRYGFHGLSYAYLLEQLEREAGAGTAHGRIIMAHLGNGASLAAVKDGKSMDTSMGFTPASGLPMGTRTGDIDPGFAWYVMQAEKLTPQQFNHLINHESGLLGMSGISSDMRELLKIEKTNKHAAASVDFFCYQTKKWIGAYAAVLEGLDTLVFSGGIGEHAPKIRERICSGLQFLGIELDEIKNAKNEAIISTGTSKVSVRVMPTNEELMIARLVHTVVARLT
jgi:acetate kinase